MKDKILALVESNYGVAEDHGLRWRNEEAVQ